MAKFSVANRSGGCREFFIFGVEPKMERILLRASGEGRGFPPAEAIIAAVTEVQCGWNGQGSSLPSTALHLANSAETRRFEETLRGGWCPAPMAHD